jgi:hypothetical protein
MKSGYRPPKAPGTPSRGSPKQDLVITPELQRERSKKGVAVLKAQTRAKLADWMRELLGYVDDAALDQVMALDKEKRRPAIWAMQSAPPCSYVRYKMRGAAAKRDERGIEIRDDETMDKLEAQRIIEDRLLPKALSRVEALLDDDQGSHGAQVTIAREIFERTLGKVTQKIDVGDSKTIEGTIERAKDAAALQREIVLMLNREPDKSKWPPDLRAAYERMVNPKSLTIEGS